MAWQLQEAKQRFSELVERAQREGPQHVTKHGRAAVVVVAADEYERLTRPKRTLLELVRNAPEGFGELDLERVQDTGRDIEL